MTEQIGRVKQLNLKLLGYTAKEIRKMVEGKKEMTHLARVGGVAIAAFSGESKHGVWHGLKGIFSMISADGEVFQSSAAFLPNNIINPVMKQLVEGALEVQFMYDIFVQETEKNASGYAFVCEPVVSDKASEKAAEITTRIINSKLPNAKKLVAPKKAA